MFRPLKTPFKDAFLEASVFTNTASTQTFTLGEAQWASAGTTGSVTTLTAKETYGQQILGVASPGADVGDAGTVARSVTTTTSAVTLAGYGTAAGAVDAGQIHYLNFATRDGESQIIARDALSDSLPLVKCRQGQPRVVLGRVTESSGTYTIAYGVNEFTLTDSGTGDLTVNLKHGFHSNPAVVVMCDEVNRFARVSAVTEASFTITIEDSGGSAADAPFHFAVFGLLEPEKFHDGLGQDVLVNGRKPRLIAAKLTNQTTEAIGGALLSSASGGTGIFDLTFTQPFAQAPFVFALSQDTAGEGYWTAIETVATASTASIKVSQEADTATLPDTLEVLVFGFDSADVF